MKKIKRTAIAALKTSVNLTVFQSSFLLFVTFDTMLWVRYLFDVKL